MSEISVSARPVYLSFRVKTRRVCFHPKLCILWPNPHSSPCTHSFQSFSLLLLPIFASFAEHQGGGGGGVGGGACQFVDHEKAASVFVCSSCFRF